MKTVLFSCVGTSDPIRGHRDGPMLHILRHYRPDAVVLFQTTEIYNRVRQDGRYEVLKQWLRQNWGYEPEWKEVWLQCTNPSDLDLISDVFDPEMRKCLQKYEEWEMLVNLSSGTPQLQILLAERAMDLRYRMHGIQVSNPEGQSGGTKRTNDPDYNIEEEIRGNLDQQPDAINRCSEPKMVRLHRQWEWQQIEAIIDRRDFESAAKMNGLSVASRKMLEHLLYRSRLESRNAVNQARGLLMLDTLYPIDYGAAGADKRVKDICEYFLILRNLQKTGRITEFVLRLNPFVVQMQTVLLDQKLQAAYGFPLKSLLDDTMPDRQYLLKRKLEEKAPDLFRAVNSAFRGGFRDSDLGIKLGNTMLRELGLDGQTIQLLADCERLNFTHRNNAAHRLENLTETDIRNCLRYSSGDLVARIEAAIPAVFPQYAPDAFEKLFRVYDLGIEYIKKQR